MKLLVCVKQVPDTTEIRIDPETNRLIRDGVPSIVNPFDGYALEMAARIKDQRDDVQIIVMSMGPMQAKEALKTCLAVGGDKAYLISGRRFGGSDTLATSYILFCAIKKLEEIEGKFDVIFCGKQAIDGDTAQVGPELAEYLGVPQVTYGLTAEIVDNEIQVTRETEDGQEILGVSFPCLVTATKPSFDPRLPTIKQKLAARKKEITVSQRTTLMSISRAAALTARRPRSRRPLFPPSSKVAYGFRLRLPARRPRSSLSILTRITFSRS